MHPYKITGYKEINGKSVEIHSCPKCGDYYYDPIKSEIVK
jgi:hypothetical protein